MSKQVIEFDPRKDMMRSPGHRRGIVTFRGKGGFTQQIMQEYKASAIAYALSIPFRVVNNDGEGE